MPTIETINIKNFRNHEYINLQFEKGINVIWGENGSGKTSILEAIYILSIGRSFRTRNHGEILKNNTKSLSLSAEFRDDNKINKIKLNQLENNQRKFFIDNIVLSKTKELIGINPVVLLCPEEQLITKGTKAERRIYFDKLLSILSMPYLNTLVSYKRTLKQRNGAIQNVRKGQGNEKSIVAWNTTMIEQGMSLWYQKQKLLNVFSTGLKNAVEKYSGEFVNIGFEFFPDADKDSYEKKLKKALNSDIKMGWTTTGPHRDDYRFNFNGRPIREYGSQGEHKIALVLIKIAEMRSIQQYTNKSPILLLDDLFAKLDFQRADDVLALLSGTNQTIITTTNIVDIEQHGIDLKSVNNSMFYLERKCKA